MLQRAQPAQTCLGITREVVGLVRTWARCSQWSALAFEDCGETLSSRLCQLLAILNKIRIKDIPPTPPKAEMELNRWSCVPVVGLHR